MKRLIEGLMVLLAIVPARAEVQIEGRVRLGSGEPVAGAQVLLFELANLRSAPVGTTTDQTGYFALPLWSLQGSASVSPKRFDLGQNYPNPFNPSTIIPYQLSAATQVRLDVFNLLGQRIATLVDAERSAGFHTARWSATDAAERAVGAGVYFYRLTGGGEHLTRRMVLIDGQVGIPVGTASGSSRVVVAEAVQASPVYGLTVSGPGLMPYVDPSFRVEAVRGLVDIEVEAIARVPLAKGVSGGLLGDVDNNGRVDVFDALLVAIYSGNSATVMPNSGKIALGDVNQDGQTDITDAWLIATYTIDPSNPELPVGIGEPVTLALDGGDGNSRQTVETVDFSSMPASNLWNLPEGTLARLGKGMVRKTIFSANGAWMAVSSYIGTWLYDTSTGAEVALIRTKEKTTGSIAVSSDGSTLAMGAFRSVQVWDAASGQIKILDGHTDWVRSVALSPDGATLASSSEGERGTILLWDVASGQLKATLDGGVGSMVFSPDGTVLASGSWDGGVRLWDAASGQPKATLEGQGVLSKAFSPDGATLASGSIDGEVQLWDVASGQLKTTLNGHKYRIYSLAFSPDGSTLAIASGDGRAGLWDVANGLFKAILEEDTRGVYALAFSPDGSALAIARDDGRAGLWDVANGRFKAILEEDTRGVYALAFSPDGSTLASSNWDGTVGLWDTANGRFKVLGEYADNNRPLAFSPDGSTLASGFFGMVRLWDTASGQVQDTWPGHTRLVSSVVFSPDCTILASGSWDGTIRLWDVAGSQIKTILENPDGSVFSLAFSPDGSALASGSHETVQLWDVASNQLRITLEGHTYWVYSVAFSPDGSTLASGSRDGTIRLWDATSGQLKKVLGHSGPVYSVAFSPDGSTLANSRGGSIQFWDVASGQLKKSLRGHGKEVYSISYAPSGAILASASLDGTILMWDAIAAEFSPPPP